MRIMHLDVEDLAQLRSGVPIVRTPGVVSGSSETDGKVELKPPPGPSRFNKATELLESAERQGTARKRIIEALAKLRTIEEISQTVEWLNGVHREHIESETCSPPVVPPLDGIVINQPPPPCENCGEVRDYSLINCEHCGHHAELTKP